METKSFMKIFGLEIKSIKADNQALLNPNFIERNKSNSNHNVRKKSKKELQNEKKQKAARGRLISNNLDNQEKNDKYEQIQHQQYSQYNNQQYINEQQEQEQNEQIYNFELSQNPESAQKNQDQQQNNNEQEEDPNDPNLDANQQLSPKKKDGKIRFPNKKPNKFIEKPFKFGNDSNLQREEIFLKKMQCLRDFNFKINYASKLYIQNPEQQVSYKIYVGRGNNSQLIKRMIKQRWWWTIVDITQLNECNLVWSQLKLNEYLCSLMPNQTQLEDDDEIAMSIQEGSDNENNQNNLSKQQLNKSQIDQSPLVKQTLQSNGINSLQNSAYQKQYTTEVLTCKENQNEESSKSFRENENNKKFNNQVKRNINTSSEKTKKHIQKPNENISSNNNNNNVNNKDKEKEKSNNDPLERIFNSNDLSAMKKYNLKYGKKDQTLMMEDLEYRLQFLPKEKKIQKIHTENLLKIKCHNHLQFNYVIGNKKAMFYNMRQYYQLKNDNVFNYLPLTFHIQRGLQDPEFKNFLKFFKQRQKEIQKQEQMLDDGKKVKKYRNIWIVKPGEVSNRGNGITVCDELYEIKNMIKSKEKHQNGKLKTYIIQLYIDRPFLYNKRKFDMRCYMLVTCINGIFRCYWYQEGYIRTSGREFSLANVSDNFVHLTNDAIQKYSDDYGKYETGNKLSFYEFQRYLDIWYSDQKLNFFTQILPQLKQIATDSIRASWMKLDPLKREYTFEIFGLDFMINDQFKPFLIEINTNPDITTSTPICCRVIPPMVENAFRVAIDPLFPPPINWQAQKKHLAPDNMLENNRFELIFDEVTDGPELIQLYKGQKNCMDGLGEIDEEEEMKSEDEEQNNAGTNKVVEKGICD